MNADQYPSYLRKCDQQDQCGRSAFQNPTPSITPRSFSSGSEICSVPPHWNRRHAGQDYRDAHPSRGRAIRDLGKVIVKNVRQQVQEELQNKNRPTSEIPSTSYVPTFTDVSTSFKNLLEDLRYTTYSPINTYLVQQLELLQQMYLDQDEYHNHSSALSEDRSSQTGDAKIYSRDLLSATEQRQIQLERQNREILRKLDALKASNHGKEGMT